MRAIEARYIKKHRLLSLPLTAADLDLAALGQKDSVHSPIEATTEQ
jgi:hypothetical protein